MQHENSTKISSPVSSYWSHSQIPTPAAPPRPPGLATCRSVAVESVPRTDGFASPVYRSHGTTTTIRADEAPNGPSRWLRSQCTRVPSSSTASSVRPAPRAATHSAARARTLAAAVASSKRRHLVGRRYAVRIYRRETPRGAATGAGSKATRREFDEPRETSVPEATARATSLNRRTDATVAPRLLHKPASARPPHVEGTGELPSAGPSLPTLPCRCFGPDCLLT
jgi:hypothetical protein